MAEIIATITSIEGNVLVQNADGTQTQAQIGQQLESGQTLVTGDGAQVSLDFGGEVITVLANQNVLMTPTLLADAIANPDENIVYESSLDDLIAELQEPADTNAPAGQTAQTDGDVTDFLDALEGDGDILDQLDATAAGAGAAGGPGGGGASFVRVGRVGETVDGEQYIYDTDATGNPGAAAGANTTDALVAITIDPIADTNNPTPTLTGTSDAGAGAAITVTVTDGAGNTQTLTTTVNADGTWSLTITTPLAEGLFNVDAQVIDSAGNTATDSAQATLDNTAPVITIDDIPPSNDPQPTITGTTDAEAGNTVTVVVTDADGNSQTLTTTVNADGTWSVPVDEALAEGDYDINATVTDNVGNISSTDNQSSIDLTAPVIVVDDATVTNNQTPTITGSSDAEPGSPVVVVVTDADGNTQTINTTLDENGIWSVTPPTALAEGTYTVDATVTDAAGNSADASNTAEIDLSAPDITVDAIGQTNDSTPTISGTTTAEPGNTVTVVITDADGNSQTATATVAADGTWSLDTPADLAEGDFTVTATVSDTAGNEATANQIGSFDATAPSLVIDTVGDTNDSTPTITGTTDVAPGSTVNLVVTDSAGNEQTLTATVTADGTWQVTVPTALSEGDFNVSATVTDPAGNSTQVDASGNLDTTAPLVSIDAQTPTNDTTPLISGTSDADPGTVVSVTIVDANGDSQTVNTTVAADGTWQVSPTTELAEGDFDVTATVSDSAGNTGAAVATGTVDTTAPVITVTSDITTNDTTPTITGTTTAEPGTTVTITVTDANGDEQTLTATVDDDGGFEVTVGTPLPEGDVDISISSQDEAGNTGNTTVTGNIDTTAPSLTVDVGTGNDTTPTISGTSDEPAGSEINITVTDSNGDTQTLVAVVNPDGTWSADVTQPLAEGDYDVSVTSTDDAENTTTVTATGSVDTTGPAITVNDIGSTNDTTPSITGSTDLDEGATVTVVFTDANSDEQTVTATVDADGNFSATPSTPLAEGDFSVAVSASDEVGNSSTTTAQGEVDTTPPALAVTSDTTVNDATPTIAGTSTGGEGSVLTLVVTDANGSQQTLTATVDANGQWQVDVTQPLAEGDFTIEASTSDAAGNSNSITANGNVDTTAPNVVVDNLGTFNDSTPVITGSTDAEVGNTVTIVVTDSTGAVQTITTTVDADGNFSAEVPTALAEGNVTVDVSITDNAGNVGTGSNDGNFDSDAPAIAIDIDSIAVTNDDTPVISGTSDAPAGTQIIVIVTDANGTTQNLVTNLASDGSWAVTVPAAMAEGNFTVTAQVTVDGTTSSTTETGEIDLTSPDLSIDTIGETNDNTPLISGTTDAPAGTEIQVVVTDANGTTQTLTATAQPDGTWQVEVPNAMADGAFNVTATATDGAGNSNTVSVNGVIDTQAPTLSIDELGQFNDTTPDISGTSDAEVGTTVTVVVTDSAGNTQTLTATVTADGTWQVTVPAPLAEGDVTVSATVSDSAGNANSASITGTLDSSAPAISLNSPGDTSDTTPTITGQTDAPAGTTVTVTVVDALGATQTLTATVGADGNFSVTTGTLAEGDFDVTAEVSVAGNSASASTTGTVDVTAPSVTIDPIATDNDTTPAITGTAPGEAGSTVTVVVTDANGDSQTLSATVAADGTWQVQTTVPLAEGNFDVTATVTDAAGNSGNASATGEVDLTGPNLTVAVDGETNDTTPLITGTSDLTEGSLVNVTVTDANGDSQTLVATVTADGSWQVNVATPLAEGNFSVIASASDPAGNNVTVTTSGNVDLTAPSITLTPLQDSNDTTPTISGTTNLAPGSQVAVVVTDANGDSQTLQATVAADGSWQVTVPTALAEGNYSVTATATDPAGNSTSASGSAEIDTTAPTLTVSVDSPTNDATPLISGTTNLPEGSEVTITVVDGNGNEFTLTATVDAAGNYQVSPTQDLVEGTLTITASATDAVGNNTTAQTTAELDLTDPSVTVNALGTTNDDTPVISGTTDLPPGSTVTVVITDSNGDSQTLSATVAGDGTYSAEATTPVAEGQVDVTVTATDSAGNSASASTTGTVNTSAPAISVQNVGDTNDATPSIQGTSDAPAGTQISITVVDAFGNSQTFTTTVNASGTWSADVPSALAEGDFDITATVTVNGNTGTATGTGTVDVTAPSITLDAIADTTDTTPALSGTSNVPEGTNISVTIVDSAGNSQTVTAKVKADGTWTVNPESPLAEGDFSVTASVSDAAGNTAQATGTGTVDLTAPSITIQNPGATNDTTPSIQGTSDADEGAVVTVSITDSAGNTQQVQTTVQANGTWSITVPTAMAEGTFSVNAEVTDAAGNTGSATSAGQIDTTAPSVTVDNPGDTNDTTPTLTGTTDLPAGSMVLVTVTDADGQTQNLNAMVANDGTWSVTVPTALAEGSFNVTATATDAAGNSATDTASGNIDLTPPAISMNALNDSNDNTPTISGTTNAPENSVVTITLVDGEGQTFTFNAIVQSDGTYSAEVPQQIADGDYTATATVSDPAGNQASASGGANIDTVPPTITVNAPDNTNDTTPIITGTSDAATGTIVYLTLTDADGNEQTFQTTVKADGTYSIEVPNPVANGDYNVRADIFDAVGNNNFAIDSGSVDGIPPIIIIDPLDPLDNTPAITGSTDVEVGTLVLVTVTDSNGIEQELTAIVKADGTWSVDVPIPLSDGNLSVEATVFDPANNFTVASASVDIDTTAPLITLNDLGTFGDPTPIISGITDADPGSIVSIQVVDSDGNIQNLQATVDTNGLFSVEVPTPLSLGIVDIDASVLDEAGNVGNDAISVNLDPAAPALQVDVIGLINDPTPVISGTVDLADGENVNITITDALGSVQNIVASVLNGEFNVTVPADLAEGPFDVDVSATTAGVTSLVSVDGILDVSSPILSLNPLDLVNDPTPLITGTVIGAEVGAPVTVEIRDSGNNLIDTIVTTVLPDGTFNVTPTVALNEGVVTVSASASDLAGNQSPVDDITVQVDLTAPSVSLNGDTLFSVPTPNIVGTTTGEVGDLVTVVIRDTSGNILQQINSTVQDGGTGPNFFDVAVTTAIPEGDFVAEVIVTDDAGNDSPPALLNGEIDLTAPVLTLDPLTVFSNNNSPVISGNVDLAQNDIVTIELLDADGNTLETLSATVGPNGDFSVSVPTTFAEDGTITVRATATDEAGNASVLNVDTTVDITPPVVSITDPGDINNTPLATITGTTDAPIGSDITIEVLDPGTGNVLQVVTTEVLTGGIFSVALTEALAEGDVQLRATATDDANNTATDLITVTVDLTAPTLALDALDPSNNSSPVVLSGTSDLGPGAVVTLTLLNDLGQVLDTVTAVTDGSGNFSTSYATALPEGIITVQADAADEAGNTATTTSLLNVDLTAPVVNITLDDAISSNLPVITASTDAVIGTDVTVNLRDSVGNVIETLTTQVLPGGLISVAATVPLPEETVNVEVVVVDSAGNSTLVDKDVTVDLTPYVVTLDSILTGDPTPVITGLTDAPDGTVASIRILDVGGNEVQVLSTNVTGGVINVALPSSLTEGSYTIEATVLDGVGNPGTASAALTLDLTAPIITGLDPVGLVNDSVVSITGVTNAVVGDEVKIVILDDGGATVNTVTSTITVDGVIDVDLPSLGDGDYTFEVSVLDQVGNESSVQSVTGVIDTLAPVINTLTLDSLTNLTLPVISGTTTGETGDTLSVTITDSGGNPVQTFSVVLAADGVFNFTPQTPLTEGDYTVAVTATDAAGNTSPIVSTGTTIDLTPPSITSLDPIGAIADATPTVTGLTDGDVGDIVRVEILDSNGDLVTTVDDTISIAGIINVDLPSLSDGDYTLNVSVLDQAGNQSPVSVLTPTIDTTAPVITITDTPTLLSPVIGGTGEPGATVELTVDLLGVTLLSSSDTVDQDGNWSILLGNLLSLNVGNTLNINVTMTDTAGNQSSVDTVLEVSALGGGGLLGLKLFAAPMVDDEPTQGESGNTSQTALSEVYEPVYQPGVTIEPIGSDSQVMASPLSASALKVGPAYTETSVAEASGSQGTDPSEIQWGLPDPGLVAGVATTPETGKEAPSTGDTQGGDEPVAIQWGVPEPGVQVGSQGGVDQTAFDNTLATTPSPIPDPITIVWGTPDTGVQIGYNGPIDTIELPLVEASEQSVPVTPTPEADAFALSLSDVLVEPSSELLANLPDSSQSDGTSFVETGVAQTSPPIEVGVHSALEAEVMKQLLDSGQSGQDM